MLHPFQLVQQLTHRWKLNVPLTSTLAHGTLGDLSRLFDVTLRMSGGGFWYRGTWAAASRRTRNKKRLLRYFAKQGVNKNIEIEMQLLILTCVWAPSASALLLQKQNKYHTGFPPSLCC